MRDLGHLQALFSLELNEVIDHFGLAVEGCEKVRVFLVVLHQSVGVFGEAKEVCLLLGIYAGSAAVGAEAAFL